MRFCHECGAGIAQQASFCAQCGVTQAPLEPQPPSVTTVDTPPVTSRIPTDPVMPTDGGAMLPPAKKSPVALVVAIAVATVMVVAGGVWFLVSPKTYDVAIVVEAYDNLTFSRGCVPNTNPGTASGDALEIGFPQSGSGVSWEPTSGVWTRAQGGNCQFEGTVKGPRGADEFSARLRTAEGGVVVFANNVRITSGTDRIVAQGDVTIYETIQGTLTLRDQVSLFDITRCISRGSFTDGGQCGQLEILPPTECRGAGSWDDMGPDTFLLALLPDGTELARERLGTGRGGQFEDWEATSRGSSTYETDCVFSFTMQVPRHTDGYVFETADRAGITNTLQEMDDEGWVLGLILRRS